MTLVGTKAPDFTATAVVGGEFKPFTLSENWKGGKYTLLFFYPLDFTFVCPTEIIAFSDRVKEFESRNVQVVGVSIDSKYSHLAWKNTPRTEGGIGEIAYPLVADVKKDATNAYGVLHPDGFAYRGLFLIDRNGVVQHELVNNTGLGRSVEEAIRMVDALQFYEKNGEVCPADWHPGAATIKPTPAGMKEYAKKNANKVTVTAKAK